MQQNIENFKEAIMRKNQFVFMKVAMAVVLSITLISCASAPKTSSSASTATTPVKKGFLEGYYDKLQPGPEGGAKQRWLKPGVDFSKYNKVMLDSMIFYFADDSEYKGIDPEELKTLSDGCNLAIVNALKDKYPIVSEPGPDVVRLRVALTGLKQSNPVLSGVTSVVPIGLGISVIKKGATDAWTGSGATTAEVMVLDSTTNTVIAVAQDEQTAGFTERFSKYGFTEEAFKFWGERMRLFLDQAHGFQPK
jgi:hypothetical protein